MKSEDIFQELFDGEMISFKNAMHLYTSVPLSELMFFANMLRKKKHPDNIVTWIIDRNVNITNICVSQCAFCNFCSPKGNPNAYITSIEQYSTKIDELYKLGGKQLLIQGGMHPDYGLNFYTELFKTLKSLKPDLKLHALGPPEIVYISKKDNLSVRNVLEHLVNAGLDSLPGAGAEILADRVRKIISPVKCSSEEWLNVMREAHKLNLVTSATMMFGHVETIDERIEHLINIRKVQDEKPEGSFGFLSFIPWPFQNEGTRLKKKFPKIKKVSSEDYIRIIAISRIILNNIDNIQASWLTVGKETAQICLHAGANDFGSIMIEENVVSSAGVCNTFDAAGIQSAISEAGFIPAQRNQRFELL
jgi:cyclic dehypoxanthinyl futalosine synthase